MATPSHHLGSVLIRLEVFFRSDVALWLFVQSEYKAIGQQKNFTRQIGVSKSRANITGKLHRFLTTLEIIQGGYVLQIQKNRLVFVLIIIELSGNNLLHRGLSSGRGLGGDGLRLRGLGLLTGDTELALVLPCRSAGAVRSLGLQRVLLRLGLNSLLVVGVCGIGKSSLARSLLRLGLERRLVLGVLGVSKGRLECVLLLLLCNGELVARVCLVLQRLPVGLHLQRLCVAWVLGILERGLVLDQLRLFSESSLVVGVLGVLERLLVLLELQGGGVVRVLGVSESSFVGLDLLLLLQGSSVVGAVGVGESFQVGSLLGGLLSTGGLRRGRRRGRGGSRS